MTEHSGAKGSAKRTLLRNGKNAKKKKNLCPYGCVNSMISDEWREMVLNYHNDQRRRVAEGKQLDKSNKALPLPAKMPQLSWDCNLEAVAHTELSKCGTISDIKIGNTKYGFNDGTLESDTKTLLKKWWNEVKEHDFPADRKYSADFRHFAPMIYEDSTGIGCTYTLCNRETKMVCAYSAERLLATGWAKNKGNSYLPIAAKMPAVTYDCAGLGAEAYDKSHDCTKNIEDPTAGKGMNKLEIPDYTMPLEDALESTYDCAGLGAEAYDKSHDCTKNIEDPTAGKGMNKLEIPDYTIPLEDALKSAMKTWWGQLESAGLPEDLVYTADMENANKITDFVRMANEQVNSVGCAVTQCPNRGVTRVVCEYNTIPQTDDVVYTKAKKRPCSGCSAIQKTCGKEYMEGLCV
ncbi:SCP-like protein [Ancylostoma caninum]|uniref:SCP-like protein n=1 Tax=Ancylostoma caninum TaxID=29170 RepID=A0A368FS96_ANCCA|nr:SCP-like protein [Ancylostoma caninum]